MPTATAPLDLTNLTAELAAKALHEFIRDLAKEQGQDPDIEVTLYDPKSGATAGYGDSWRVMWEAGPFEWGVSLTLGGSLYAPDSGDYSYTKPTEVKLLGSEHWIAEPHFGFDVGFSNF